MNKKLQAAILSIAISVCFDANAQTGSCELYKNLLPAKYEAYKPVNVGNRSTAKTTATGERLIANSSYSMISGSSQVHDSNRYVWSGGRTSSQTQSQGVIEVETDLSDQLQNWNINFGSLALQRKQMQTFDADGNILETTVMKWDNPSSSWIVDSKVTRTYTGKLMDTYVEQSQDLITKALVNFVRRELSYITGKLKTDTWQRWDDVSATWENNLLIEYDYSKASELSITYKKWDATSSTWQLSNNEYQIFSGANIIENTTQNWIGGTWINIGLYKATYSGSDLVSWSQQFWNTKSNTWENNSKGLFTFAAGNPVKYEYFSWIDYSGSWDLDWDNLFTYAGKSVTEQQSRSRDKGTGTMLNGNQWIHNYNSVGNLTRTTVNEWKSGAWMPVTYFHTQNYYYETYTGINEDTPYVSSVNIYPNPATASNVYVDYFTQQSEQTDVVLSNILGQEILRKTEAAGIGDHSVMIPVSSLSAGMYVVSIYSNGQLQKTMKLVK